MSLHCGSVFSRLSKRSAISDTSPLAVHLGNDTAMRRLLRDGVGIKDIQKKYLSLCYSARPSVQPSKGVAQALGAGELVWNLTACEKEETAVIATLLTTKEAHKELRSVVISTAQSGCPSVRKRAGLAKPLKQGSLGSSWGPRGMAMERDPAGQVDLFTTLCKALPQLDALRSLELEGLRRAFKKSGAGAACLAQGLKGNSKLKSLAVRHVRLADPRALGALSSAVSGHPSLVTVSLVHCCLSGEQGGRLAAAVVGAHAARREGMVWSTGLRQPPGVVENTAAAAPAKIATAGCLTLDMSGNRLGDAGVHAVARGLQSDTWLVGINLSDNGVTDRGAATLSVCLQHNASLCALVLDGNPEIGREAERRLTAELETRSMMPEAVLEEPEVVLTLAQWGFSVHAGFEESLSPLLPDAASDSVVSDLSRDGSGGSIGGGGGGGSGGGGDGGFLEAAGGDGAGDAAATATTSGLSKTTFERKEEMVREFRRWAGYAPRPVASGGPASDANDVAVGAAGAGGAGRAGGVAAGATADVPPEVSDKVAAATATGRGGGQSRARTRADVVAASGSRDEREDEASTRAIAYARSHARARARSVSARSMAYAAFDGGGRVTKRSKSSGPSRRGVRGRSQLRAPGAAVEQSTDGRAPWGAGPRVGGARARARAWASTHLGTGKPNGFGAGSGFGGSSGGGSGSGVGGRGGGTGRARKFDDVSGGTGSTRCRARVRRGRVAGAGGCGGTNTAPRNLAKDTGRNMRGNRAGRKACRRGAGAGSIPRQRGGAAGGDGGEPGKVRGIGFGAEHSTCGSPLRPAGQDITWDVLDAEGNYPEFDLRRGGGQFYGGAGIGPREDARTGRVLEMLASLEKVVVDVCKDMWRLEDRIEGTEHLASRGSEQRQGVLTALDESSKRENQDRFDGNGGNDGNDGDNNDSDGNDDRDEVAAQVEACLREMWHQNPADTAFADPRADGGARSSRLGGGGGGGGSGDGGGGGGGGGGGDNAVASLGTLEEGGGRLRADEARLQTGRGGGGGGGRGGSGFRATEKVNVFRASELEWEVEREENGGAARRGGGGGGGGRGGLREEIGEKEGEEEEGEPGGGKEENLVLAACEEGEEEDQAVGDSGGALGERAASARGARGEWSQSVLAEQEEQEEMKGVEEGQEVGWDGTGSGEETLVEGLEIPEEGGLDEEAVDVIEIVVPPSSFSGLVLVVADLERVSPVDLDSTTSSTA